MAKRRSKNKAKRELTGNSKNTAGEDGQISTKHEMDNKSQFISETNESTETCEVKMQVTETEKLDCSATEKVNVAAKVVKGKGKMKLKQKHYTTSAAKRNKSKELKQDVKLSEGVLLFPREVDGETCLDIDCGDNKAVMVLSKLYVGSKGACIKYLDEWLTPNEFQLVSGRESAKDWKRSIRHSGRSLKILITKGLVTVKSPSPTKSPLKLSEKSSSSDSDRESGEEADVILPETATATTDMSPEKVAKETIVLPETALTVLPEKALTVLPETALVQHNELPEIFPEILPVTTITPTNVLPEPVAEQNNMLPATTAEQPKMLPDTAAEQPKMLPDTAAETLETVVDQKTLIPETACLENIRSNLPGKKRGRKPKKKRPGRKPASIDKVEPETNLAVHELAKSIDDVEVKTECSAQTLDSGKITNSEDMECVQTSDIDTRTDEERRLDEFVKSLSLTKTTASTTLKVAPELPAIDLHIDLDIQQTKMISSEEDVELEMPILQKESVIQTGERTDAESIQNTTNTVVDPFHATVTPPPTPPSEQSLIIPKVEEEHADTMEMYNSRLLSPSEGLKLTINRKKVNVKPENNNKGDMKKQNMQTLLLQDALNSAKKYKERLQQTKKLSANNSVLQIPKVNIEAAKRIQDEPVLIRDATSLSNVKCFPAKVENDTIEKPSFKQTKSGNTVTNATRQTGNTADQMLSGQHSSAHIQDMMNKLGGVSFNELMSIMPSIYGALPFPVDNNDTVLSVLQELQRKSDMVHLMTPNGGGVCGSPLLYPMITQQILVAMTQQLYRMYNLPQQSQQSQQQQQHQQQQQRQPVHRRSTEIHASKSHSKPHINVPNHIPNGTVQPNQNVSHNHLQGNTMHRQQSMSVSHNKRQHVSKDHAHLNTINSVPYDLSNKKRKHSDVDTDGVLDLSMKKPKVVPEMDQHRSLHNGEAPLDFSVTRGTSTMKQTTQIIRHNMVSSTSVPDDIGYSEHYSNLSRNAAHPSKGSHSGCKCSIRREAEDINNWSVERVCSFLTTLDGCGPYAQTFHDQGISGRLLPYLTTQHLTRTLGMKVGPALTLMHAVERKFREKTTQQSCTACKQQHTASVIM